MVVLVSTFVVYRFELLENTLVLLIRLPRQSFISMVVLVSTFVVYRFEL